MFDLLALGLSHAARRNDKVHPWDPVAAWELSSSCRPAVKFISQPQKEIKSPNLKDAWY